jgi:uncharacterized protein (TIGR03437 family)
MLIRNLSPLLLLAASAAVFGQTGPTYRFHTTVGDIDVVLTPSAAPLTVANFINYVNAGAYVNSIFHRSVPGFVIQAGGYQLQNGNVITTPTNAPVMNEFNVSNALGTIAMAKLGSDPNSATSQWFFNLANNGTNGNALDTTNGGYTVFGNVTSATQKVMNAIAGVGTYDCSGDGGVCPLSSTNSAFTNLPVLNGNYILVTSIVPVPTLTSPGFVSAASFAASNLNGVSPGEMIAIFGTGIGPTTGQSFTVTNGALSTTLAGVQVTFNGKPAPIVYASASQVNLIAPLSLGSPLLPSVDVVLTYQGTVSNTIVLPVKASNPAIFTLSGLGTGDAAIVRLDGSIVSAASPAAVGDVLELYGEGYGVPTPATTLPDGEIITTTFPIPADPTTLLLIDGQAVPTLYFGGAIVNGALQVNFKVPQLAPGSHQIQLQVGTRTSPTGVTLQTK